MKNLLKRIQNEVVVIEDSLMRNGKLLGDQSITVALVLTDDEKELFKECHYFESENFWWEITDNVLYLTYSGENFWWEMENMITYS